METKCETAYNSQTIRLDKFEVAVVVDVDGHLSLFVKSTDGSNLVDITDEMCDECEVCLRFSTEAIEHEYNQQKVSATNITVHENNAISDEAADTTIFDAGRQFDSPNEAIALIMRQSDPTEALLAVVRANVEADECGFASEVLRDFGRI